MTKMLWKVNKILEKISSEVAWLMFFHPSNLLGSHFAMDLSRNCLVTFAWKRSFVN